MRLWHKDLIDVLPREQLVAQWRECSAIAKRLITNGTPNHILVNYVAECPIDNFISYSFYVREEMTKREYRTMDKVWDGIVAVADNYSILPLDRVYVDEHNNRYLNQCYYNLQEKYDRGYDHGGMKTADWAKIVEKTHGRIL